ncbi:MAG: NAD(P)H-binding protein [Opitutales bacterium]|nr:NAD(P)H-binding protein [Opitutales bacterium]
MAEGLCAEGHAVTVVSRSEERFARLAPGIGAVVADLATSAWHERVPAGVDFVVNCVSGGGGDLAGYRRSYVEGMASIRRWAAAASPRGFIYTGSTGVYPQTDGGRVFEDDVPAEETPPPRRAILLEAEAAALKVSAARRVVLRFSGLYGPGRHYLLDALMRGELVFPAPADFFLNLLHRDDAVAAIRAAAEADLPPGGHVYNVSDNAPSTKEAVIRWVASELGCPPPVFDEAQPDARRQRRLVGGLPPHRIVDASRFRRETGWVPQYPDFQAGYRPLLEAVRRK